MVGKGATDSGETNYTLELYYSEAKYAILQIRADTTDHSLKDFVNKLSTWAQRVGITRFNYFGSNSPVGQIERRENEIYYMRNAASDV